jgi:hypothetical protein
MQTGESLEEGDGMSKDRTYSFGYVTALLNEIAILKSEVGRAMEALEPFANMWEERYAQTDPETLADNLDEFAPYHHAAETYADLKARYPAPAEGEGK